MLLGMNGLITVFLGKHLFFNAQKTGNTRKLPVPIIELNFKPLIFSILRFCYIHSS